MRLSSIPLLLATLAMGAATLNCGSPDADDDANSTDQAQSVPGIPNDMGLKLVYDVKSSTVRGTVTRALQNGEELRMQIRRGRLSAQSPLDLDCTRLPSAPPLASTDPSIAAEIYDATFQYFSENATVYQGPFVDPTLLATVYDTRWIIAHATPKGLEQLQTQGADSIAEACIMHNGVVHSRMQTTIAQAWDESDPLLQGHPLTDHTGTTTASVSPCAGTSCDAP